jgi:hypothetical protein
MTSLNRLNVFYCGKNWDKTHSKLCSQLDKNTVNGLHVFNHLFDYVQVKTFIENKIVYYYWFGKKMELKSSSWMPRFYVDHKTGQLRKAK